MKIAVLTGGISSERNVSLVGGKAVLEALLSLGHDAIAVDPALGKNCIVDFEKIEIPTTPPDDAELAAYSSHNLLESVMSSTFDGIEVAFNLLHGTWGEDGRFQALLESRGIKYSGSGVRASSTAMHKHISKMLFASSGLLTPEWDVIRKNEIATYELMEELRNNLGSELVIKPNDQGSTIGISIIRNGNLDDMLKGVELAKKFSGLVLIEKFIEGREITCAIIGNESYPIIEIIPPSGFYDYAAKYTKGQSEYICPAEVDEDIAEFIQSQALTAFGVIGCSGFARADFRLTEEGQPYILEMNTVPGFTETSLVPMAAAQEGHSFADLCNMIIELTLKGQ